MFSPEEKKKIAKEVERILLSFGNPEMPKEKPYFELHVKGEEGWSWADIKPNWCILPFKATSSAFAKEEL